MSLNTKFTIFLYTKCDTKTCMKTFSDFGSKKFNGNYNIAALIWWGWKWQTNKTKCLFVFFLIETKSRAFSIVLLHIGSNDLHRPVWVCSHQPQCCVCIIWMRLLGASSYGCPIQIRWNGKNKDGEFCVTF